MGSVDIVMFMMAFLMLQPFNAYSSGDRMWADPPRDRGAVSPFLKPPELCFPMVLGCSVKGPFNPQKDHGPQVENHWPNLIGSTGNVIFYGSITCIDIWYWLIMVFPGMQKAFHGFV